MESIKQFKFDPSRGVKPNEELIAPPTLTDKVIPFNYNYAQNPSIKVTSDPKTGTLTLNHMYKHKPGRTIFLGYNSTRIPTEPHSPPSENNAALLATIKALKTALESRPIYSRRALANHLASISSKHLPHLKPAIQYVGYQFRGGPWRDAVIRFGLDPRTDPQYRKYQTLFFKIYDKRWADSASGAMKPPSSLEDHDWAENRPNSRSSRTTHADSHIFNGKTLSVDGKIWQLCDITDPMLRALVERPGLREKCDVEGDGWYLNGTMAKIKAIMRTKIGAIRIGREMGDEEFAKALAVPDEVKGVKVPNVPVPEWKVEEGEGPEELLGDETIMKKKRIRGTRRMTGIVRARRESEEVRGSESAGAAEEPENVTGGLDVDEEATPMAEDDPVSGEGEEEDEDSEQSRSNDEEEDGEEDDMELDADDEPAYGFGGYDSDGIPIEY